MILHIDFFKVSGAGNDFVLVDNFAGQLEINWPQFARATCSRKSGIGADGLLVINPSGRHDFHMRYYNSDGSYGGMCGNGGRCVARYARLKGISQEHVVFEALDEIYEASVVGELVSLRMMDVPLSLEELAFRNTGGTIIKGHFLDTGSPHVVIQVSDLDRMDVDSWGRLIVHDAHFEPAGANANFFIPQGPNRIALRTFERGVNAETLACGTGAVAAAVTASNRLGLIPPINVSVRSGESLGVSFSIVGNCATDVTLTGSAHFLFSGFVLFDTEKGDLHDLAGVPPTSTP